MARLQDLLDRVHDEMPAVPKALALRALSDALREFCERTHVWQDALPDITLVPQQTTYELSPDAGLRAVALKEVRIDGRRIVPLATEVLQLTLFAPPPGEPQGYVQHDSGEVELVPPPMASRTMSMRAALAPKLGAVDMLVPDSLLDDYGEVLASGAKMRLVRQAGQPWFNPDLVLAYGGPFYAGVDSAKTRVSRALGEAQVQVQMRRW